MKTESITVKLSELAIDSANVRKTGRGTEPKFAASIRKRGVLEPLIVRRGVYADHYSIVNGGERFTALQFLKKKGEKANGVPVTDGFEVRVEIMEGDEDTARATSLATNLIRSDMHPVDEFEAFAAMIAAGATTKDVATEYARTEAQVRQALSLAAIAQEVRKAWRDGLIDGEAAEAYAQTKDLAFQVRVMKKLKNRAGEEYMVRNEIAGGTAHQTAALLKFVGQKEYEKAGHQVNASLFTDDERHTAMVDNVPALKAMALRKVSDECDRLTKDGWAWALPKEEAPKDIYAWRRLPPGGTPTKEQKGLAGCTVDVNYNGTLEIVRGYIKPGVSVKIPKTAAQKAAAPKTASKPASISAALSQRLSASLTKAMATTVAGCDHIGVLKMALAGLICSGTFSESPVCLENKGAGAREEDDADGYIFAAELARLDKLTGRALEDLFAKTVGASLELGTHSADRVLVSAEGEVEDESAAALVGFVPQKPLQSALRKEFEADDYFENSPGAMALAALRDMAIDPLKNAKKAALAKQAADAAKKAGWLPPQLRTEGYEGPKAKAAPKKKMSRKKRR